LVEDRVYRGTNASSQDPTVGLCIGPYDGPGEGGGVLVSEVPLYKFVNSVAEKSDVSPNW
jgi:hypothetical protein